MIALSILGFLSFFAFLIIFIVNAIKKKSKKIWAICTGVSFVLFFIGVAGATPPQISSQQADNHSVSPPQITSDIQKTLKYTYNQTLVNCYPIDPATGQPVYGGLQLLGASGFQLTNISDFTWYGLQVYVDVSGEPYSCGFQKLYSGQSYTYNNTNLAGFQHPKIDFGNLSGDVNINMCAQITYAGPIIAITPQLQTVSPKSVSVYSPSQLLPLSGFLIYQDTNPGNTTQGISIAHPEVWKVTPQSSSRVLQFQSPKNECNVSITVPMLTSKPATLVEYVQQALDTQEKDIISGNFYRPISSLVSTTISGFPAFEMTYTQKQFDLSWEGITAWVQAPDGEIYRLDGSVFHPANYTDYYQTIHQMFDSFIITSPQVQLLD